MALSNMSEKLDEIKDQLPPVIEGIFRQAIVTYSTGECMSGKCVDEIFQFMEEEKGKSTDLDSMFISVMALIVSRYIGTAMGMVMGSSIGARMKTDPDGGLSMEFKRVKLAAPEKLEAHFN